MRRLGLAATLAAEDVVVFTDEFGPYAGRDIAAAGLQGCAGCRHWLIDITDPTTLLRYRTGGDP